MTMPVNDHSNSHVIPMCSSKLCEDDATMMVAFENGDATPHCFPCGTAVLYNTLGAREYPLEVYYTRSGEHVSEYNPQGVGEFDLFDPDDPHLAWAHADNDESPGSSVHPQNWC